MVNFWLETLRRPVFIHVLQNLFATLLNVILIFLLTKYFSVSEFGLFAFLKSLSSILDYSHLGTRYGLDTELINNKKNADLWIDSVSSLVVLVGGGIVLFLLVFYNQLYEVLFLLGGYLLSIITARKLVFRALGNENMFVKLSSIQNIFPLIVQVLCVFLASFKVFAWSYFLSILVIFVYMNQYLAFFKLKLIDLKTILHLIYYGRVLFILTLVAFMFNGFDRIILSNYLEDKTLGYYSFVFILSAMISIIPMSISEIVMSKLLDRSNTDRLSVLFKTSKINISFSFLTILLLFFSLSFILCNFFPQYIHLKNEIIISLVIVLPLGLLQPLQLYLISLNDHKYLIYSSLIFGILFLASLVFFSMHGFCSLKFLILMKVIYFFLYFFSCSFRVWSKKFVYG